MLYLDGTIKNEQKFNCFGVCRKSGKSSSKKKKDRDPEDVDVNIDKSKAKKEPVKFSIAEEETEGLMATPEIVVDPPSKGNTPDESSPLHDPTNV